tara:strand:- start:1053 stop:1736 length:684 start_codon:yes stop_codon:yes gene_type:complete
MRIESKLCHVSENKTIVQVIGWSSDKNLGSALGEGPTVEHAEDRAISRLKERLNIKSNIETSISSNNENKIKTPLKIELPKNNKLENTNISKDPSDWSNELAAIDVEIERLKWSRDDEKDYLEKTFGFNSRNKITNYRDIVEYLSLLRKINSFDSNNNIKAKIKTLIDDSDTILSDLSWDNKQGREYLQKEFNVSTRMELDEKQLISFVEKLKKIRNQYQVDYGLSK